MHRMQETGCEPAARASAEFARPRRVCGATRPLLVGALALTAAGSALAAGDARFEHVGRYNHQLIGRDHLVGVMPIFDHFAVTCSYDALRVINLDALPPGQGTNSFVSELRGHDVYSLVPYGDEYLFANLRLGGFGVVHIDPATKAIEWLTTVEEPGVYFEDMAVAGHRLYVAAHAYGIRCYDVSTPEEPALIGSLGTGFTDAFAIAVDGRTAYVADGAGGLKVVDVANPAAMRVVAGERVNGTALGTAEDVAVIDGDVYLAAGSAGVLTYENGDVGRRHQFQTPGIARALADLHGYLAVADITGINLFELAPDAMLKPITTERGLHRMLAGGAVSLRLWHGVAAWGSDHLLAANWDSVDVYRIVPLASSTQPDANLSNQRVRFEAAGGTINVKLSNSGAVPLNVTSIATGAANFTVTPHNAMTIAPGASVNLAVTYTPGTAAQTLLKVTSNDPDESILPAELFGNTGYIDPGQPAVPFTLPMWTYDHERELFTYSSFSLTEQLGKVVYFQIFGTWCPACMPVVCDVQNSIGALFEHHPQVSMVLISQKEDASLLDEYWHNLYLRMPMLFDLSGSVSYVAYQQPASGLPFSRSFLVTPTGMVKETWFGFNGDAVTDAIYRQLATIAIPGDANLDGRVDRDDITAIHLAWGPCGDPTYCPADLNHDGEVDALDILEVLGHFGDVAG